MKDIIIVCGATATGKSDLAIHAAKQLNGEIISADSMQIYKHMDIGTAKVTKSEMQGIPHHLIDVVEPHEQFSVAEFQEKANAVINDVLSRGKTPIIVGGTGLYINSLIYDYTFGGTMANFDLREKYRDYAENHGNEALYDILKEKSPEIAQKLHPNDVKRIIRALELIDSGENVAEDERKIIRPYKAIALNPDRAVLYEKINKRVDIMFENGLLDEINNLIENYGVNFECQSMKAIGYKEFYGYFYEGESLDSVKEKIKKNSRNYAKRQFTWFRKMPNLEWFCDKSEAIKAIEEWKND